MATMATEATPHLGELPSSDMAPPRLHNFIFLTPGWGAGQILRCRKIPKTLHGDENAGSGGSLVELPSPSKVQSISPEVPENAERRWNLRRRKASSESVVGASGKKKRKFSVSLSLNEIEIDFLLMNGKKPHKRPKKRPRHVQKQVDSTFPGMWLHDVTPDRYKVE